MKGYLDRIEDGKWAVILVEEIGDEFIIPVEKLPEGISVKSYFNLTIENGELTSIVFDPETTAQEVQKTEELLAKIRAKSRGSKFKKK